MHALRRTFVSKVPHPQFTYAPTHALTKNRYFRFIVPNLFRWVAGLDHLHVHNGWWKHTTNVHSNARFREEPFNAIHRLARVPVFQIITFSIYRNIIFIFQSFGDNHLKDFNCTLCATFTFSAKSYQHEWTYGQHCMQLLPLFPHI